MMLENFAREVSSKTKCRFRDAILKLESLKFPDELKSYMIKIEKLPYDIKPVCIDCLRKECICEDEKD